MIMLARTYYMSRSALTTGHRFQSRSNMSITLDGCISRNYDDDVSYIPIYSRNFKWSFHSKKAWWIRILVSVYKIFGWNIWESDIIRSQLIFRSQRVSVINARLPQLWRPYSSKIPMGTDTPKATMWDLIS